MKTILIFLFSLLTLSINAQHNWQRTNPGGGGAIAVVGATSSGMIVVASDLSGIYRSNDDGQSWDVVGANQGLEETHISSFGFSPTDSSTFFAGSYRGLYKTSDGGDSFTFVFPGANNNFNYSYIEDIAISESNSNIGYVTHHLGPETSGDVYKTIDGGNTWNAVVGEDLPNNLHIVKLMVHPSDEDVVYALSGKSRWGCGDANLYRSTDGGVIWTEIGSDAGDVLDFDLHPTNPLIVFVSTFVSTYEDNSQCKDLSFEEYYTGDETQGALYKSINGGNTFVEIGEYTGIISVGIDNPDIIRVMDVLFPYEWNDLAGTWETTNGGGNWQHTGLLENWNQGYSENEYYAYALSFNGLNKTVSKDLFNSDRYYGSYGQWAWGSFDGGATFNNISTKEISPNHWISTGVENINGHCLDVNENNPNVVYMGAWDIGFWVSQDHGDSWTQYQPNYNTYPQYSWDVGEVPVPAGQATHGAGSNVTTLLNDPDRDSVVWASFSREQLTDISENTIAYTGLFKSTNYGEDWVLITDGLPTYSDSYLFYGLALDRGSPLNDRKLFITIKGDIYRSTDDGDSWSMVLANGNLKFIEVDKTNSQNVYAGGKDGLWKSENGGTDWIEVGTAAMHNTHSLVRPDIVPTWVDWSDVNNPIYPWEGVFDIETDPNVINRLYVTVLGPNKGLFRSNDGGSTWTQLTFDDNTRGVSIAPQNSEILYVTSSAAYHSGGFGNSAGIQYSEDAGQSWQDANDGMAYNYAGTIEIETGVNPLVWVWSPGTGVQNAEVPFFQGGVELNLKVYLEGAYNENNQLMNDNLRQLGVIPLVEPYTSFGFTQVNGGGESTSSSVLTMTGNNAIVDWIFVELRDSNSPTTIVATQSALLQRDGDVVSVDGSSPILFSGVSNTEVFVVLRHRNHFGIRTNNTFSTANPINVNFTSTSLSLFGLNPTNSIGNVRVMIAADANLDGQVNAVDKNNYWRIENGELYNYLNSKADFNLDGAVNPVDKNSYWRINNSRVEQLD